VAYTKFLFHLTLSFTSYRYSSRLTNCRFRGLCWYEKLSDRTWQSIFAT